MTFDFFYSSAGYALKVRVVPISVEHDTFTNDGVFAVKVNIAILAVEFSIVVSLVIEKA